ncbi:hypothetical protein ABZ777_32450 [Micromonospora parva]|uniref:hypothetical protein n=1 Tax=Micromonospora parva TaxID=1464048 RepID=UPI0033DE7502
MPDQPASTNQQWQKLLDAALDGARDDARDQVGDAMCEAYSLGIAVGVERQAAPPTSSPLDRVTQLLVTVNWHGDYYNPGERADMLREWIESALTDRDDSPAVTITEVPAPGSDLANRRRLLDQAIDAALPASGGRVAALLVALRDALADLDAKRSTVAAAVAYLRQG